MGTGRSGAREGLSTVTRGTLVLLVGTLGFVIENFVARVLLVRVLPTEEWTSFSLALAASGLLAAFGSLGVGAALARTLPYAKAEAERRQMIRTAFQIVVPTVAVIIFGVFLIGQSSPNRSLTGLPVTLEFLAVAAGFSVLCGLVASIFQGFEDVSANAYFVQIINPSLFLAFIALAFLAPGVSLGPPFFHGASFHLSYLEALLGYTLAAGVTLGALLWYARVRLPRLLPAGPTPGGWSRRLAWFALPLFVVTIFAYLTQNADTLILGYTHTSEVGQYTASLSLARLLQVGISSLGYIFLPVTTRFIRDQDTDAVRLTYTTTTKWTILTALPFFLLFFFLPIGSMAFVYGSAYAIDALPLQILVMGAFASTLVGPSQQAQVAYGRTTALLFNTVGAAGVDLLLAVWLVPPYGITGAAIAWGAANALLPILSITELAFFEGVHPFHQHYLVPLVVTTVPLGVLFLLVPFHPVFYELPLIGIGVALLYGLVVVGTRSVDDGDHMLVEVIEGWVGFRLPLVHRLGRWRRRGGLADHRAPDGEDHRRQPPGEQ